MKKDIGQTRVWTEKSSRDGASVYVGVACAMRYDGLIAQHLPPGSGSHAILSNRAEVESVIAALQEALKEMP